MTVPPTARQASVLAAIAALTLQKRRPPTQRELAQQVGLSQTRIRQHLDELARRHLITIEAGTARSVAVCANAQTCTPPPLP